MLTRVKRTSRRAQGWAGKNIARTVETTLATARWLSRSELGGSIYKEHPIGGILHLGSENEELLRSKEK